VFRRELRRKRGKGGFQDFKEGEVTASFDEIVHHNMLLTEAIVELLAEKGILAGSEVKERIQKLKAETKLNFKRVQ
jgi:hypothetical protein